LILRAFDGKKKVLWRKEDTLEDIFNIEISYFKLKNVELCGLGLALSKKHEVPAEKKKKSICNE